MFFFFSFLYNSVFVIWFLSLNSEMMTGLMQNSIMLQFILQLLKWALAGFLLLFGCWSIIPDHNWLNILFLPSSFAVWLRKVWTGLNLLIELGFSILANHMAWLQISELFFFQFCCLIKKFWTGLNLLIKLSFRILANHMACIIYLYVFCNCLFMTGYI